MAWHLHRVPAARNLPARAKPGDDVVCPGIVARVSVGPQVGGIPAFLARRVVAIIAVDLGEASVHEEVGQFAGAIQAHALRAGWGSFRFTPAVQALAAFDVALDLHAAEGGQPARLARYAENMRTLLAGVQAIGLTPYLAPADQGPVILTIHQPADPRFALQAFVDALKARGVLISNFYNTKAPTMRIGCIGAVTAEDMRRAVTAIDGALGELGIRQREAA